MIQQPASLASALVAPVTAGAIQVGSKVGHGGAVSAGWRAMGGDGALAATSGRQAPGG